MKKGARNFRGKGESSLLLYEERKRKKKGQLRLHPILEGEKKFEPKIS